MATANNEIVNLIIRDSLTGFERVIGSPLADYIAGPATATTIDGGAGADFILGGAVADNIVGGDGADSITGGTGADIITGVGATTSLADVLTANGLDTITGYAVADDILNFTAIAGTTKGTVADIGLNITATDAALAAADNVLIFNDGTAAMMFANVTALAGATTAFTTITAGNVIIVYTTADGAAARVALATIDATGDITAAVELAVLVGIDVDNVTVGMFTML